MRPIWTGAITFGLVNVPVKLYGATEDHDVKFHQVHDADGGRIRYERRCEVCGEKVEYQHIDKAYDDGDRTVIVTDEDFKSLPAAEHNEIDVVQFVPNDQVDPIMFEKPYFLEPVGKSPKSYLLLRETLEKADQTAIVKFSLRQKTRLGALRTRGKVMVLQGMLWADEVREVDFPAVSSRAKISPQELKMSAALVEQFSGDFHPEEFEDDYQAELQHLIDEKLEQGDAFDTATTFGKADEEESDEGGDVVDLMEALKKSIDRKRGGGGAEKKAAASSGSRSRATSSKKKGA
ncbi:non-homologous end joining protein Ku [Tersicoccus solisilvae]|uniref:Non-homologous end joining protein Ku n=1 Tax=Tersicoccus solisilvae TaxID=1882339 RepID=A0ABQ1NJ47_9MICC|nr:Ku protein [Tersicoccus solisilvae]GGC78546.1 non-homologous end joining protein Ku [Tersicoccus solisilvae]